MHGFTKSRFAAPIAGKTKAFDVYRIGSGPPVILMQELPGIGEEVITLCHRLADAGFEVWAPHWFGLLGRTDAGNLGRVLCMRFEEDGFCTGERFAAIDGAFNDDAVRVVTHVIAGRGHAVLSRHYDETPGSPTEAAMRDVINYLRQQLSH